MRISAAALLLAPCFVIKRVEAACSPASPVNNATVSCTGTTTDSNGTNGYGTLIDVGNTYVIGPGATLTGTDVGLVFETGTVNNSGAVTGGSFAVEANRNAIINNIGTSSIISATGNNASAVLGSELHVRNDGSITASGTNGIAVDAGNTEQNEVFNSGAIEGTAAGIRSVGTIAVTNSGRIEAAPGGTAIFGSTNVNLLSNTGIITGGRFAITADIINLVNDRTGRINQIDPNGSVISVRALTGSNAGQIVGLASNSRAIDADIVNLTNTGLIQADLGGVKGRTVTVTNEGKIASFAANSIAIQGLQTTIVNTGSISGSWGVSGTNVSVSNSGTIAGDVIGISAADAKIRNSGLISGANAGYAIGTVRSIDLDNSGVIRGSGAAEALHIGGGGTIVNTGSVVADRAAILHFANPDVPLTITNAASGTIIGADGILSAGTVNFVNAGTIRGTNSIDGTALLANVVNVNNSGSIAGIVGILSLGAANVTNSGAVTGTGGTAIKLSNAADTLTLLPGSKINGVVDFDFGADVVNVNLTAPTTRVSSLTTIQLPTFVNFEGTIKTNISKGNFNGPSVVSGTSVATLDPTALAQTDRTLMDFTGGVSSLVQGRLSGGAGPAGSNMMAMAYAPETAQAGPFTKASRSLWTDPAPITVWANSFGGQRIQDETASTLRATSTAWGGAIGLDRKVRPDWLVGAFLGGGQGGLSVDLNSQNVDTNYVFVGVYSRFEWASQFFDFSLQGGNADNRSRRLVLNNAVVGGMETARANYSGWYISPEVAYGYRLNIGNGYVLTPTARLRYVAGRFDGYSETGSAQSLAIGGRTLQDFEERGEVDLSRVTAFAGGELKANIHGGVIALQRAGDTNINAVLLGQNLSFVTPGSRSTVGAVAGLGFDYRTSRNVSVFGAVEGVMMSDQSRTGAAKGGVRVAF
ncbi:autotransporter domain-containing protein [Bradyrhizobium diazoefficiens]|nr:autotransporter outer membrane beta-barrel domain-containing protein [Bradyrhizobium diazoefficiens]MBR0927762.1 autotransporter domain-containing protein [Bradyrhizobium diazoefficiens]